MANKVDHPRNVILRQETLIKPLDTWLAGELGSLQRRHTITKLLEQAADVPVVTAVAPVGPTVAECDAKPARYRAALEAGAEPAAVAGSIADTQAERQRAEQHQQAMPAPRRRTPPTISPKWRSSPSSKNSATWSLRYETPSPNTIWRSTAPSGCASPVTQEGSQMRALRVQPMRSASETMIPSGPRT